MQLKTALRQNSSKPIAGRSFGDYLPDAVNQPKFPSIILHPGSMYHQRTGCVFSVQ